MKILMNIILSLSLILSGCASMKVNFNSDESHIAVGGLVGGLGGAALAPKDEKREVHGGIWALIIAGLVAIYKVVTNKYKKQNQELKDEVYLLKNPPKLRPVDKFKVKNDEPLFPGGPTSGTWEYNETDIWVPDGRGRLLHYDKEFKRIDGKKKKNEK